MSDAHRRVANVERVKVGQIGPNKLHQRVIESEVILLLSQSNLLHDKITLNLTFVNCIWWAWILFPMNLLHLRQTKRNYDT
jgi:hypothetical protein